MGCNCKANKKIEDIYKVYGHNDNNKKNNNIIGVIKNIIIYIIAIFLIPFMFLHILYKSVIKNENYVSVKNLIKLGGYVRK